MRKSVGHILVSVPSVTFKGKKEKLMTFPTALNKWVESLKCINKFKRNRIVGKFLWYKRNKALFEKNNKLCYADC